MLSKDILKTKFLTCDYAIDNEYLDKYLNIIINNSCNYIKFKTDKHHILPAHYFKYNNLEVDNSDDNLVYLLIKDHILAHYYLAQCTFGKNKYANLLAVRYSINKNTKFEDISEYWLLENLKDLEQLTIESRQLASIYAYDRTGINNPFYGRKHSEETKAKISKAKTNPSSEIRKHLSEAQKKVDHSRQVQLMAEYNLKYRDYSQQGAKISATKKLNSSGNNRAGKIKISKDNINKYIKPEDLSYYQNLGFEINKQWLMNKQKQNKNFIINGVN